MKKSIITVLINIGFDILLAGVGLVVFALFHHVIPIHSGPGSVLTIPSNVQQKQEKTKMTLKTSVSDDNKTFYTTISLSGDEELKSLKFDICYLSDAVQFSAVDEKLENSEIIENDGKLGFFVTQPKNGDLCKLSFKILSLYEDKNAVTLDFTKEDFIKTDNSFANVVVESDTQKPNAGEKDKFADKFTTGEIIKTDSIYKSENLNVTLEKNVDNSDGGIVTYFVADIYLRDVKHFKTSLANEVYGKGYRQSIEDLSKQLNGIIAINGDYYGARDNGVVVRNGILYRQSLFEDVCVLYMDGTMETFEKGNFNLEVLQATHGGIWQAWSFGPELLKNGQPKTEFNSKVTVANPRTAIGYYEPGHYCFILVEGRQDGYSDGYTMKKLSQLFYDKGCSVAYNLDGGQSSVMAWDGKLANHPYNGGRSASDAIVITEN